MITENCPRCHRQVDPTDITWPIDVDGATVEGGCQGCWEADCAVGWWAFVAQGGTMIGLDAELMAALTRGEKKGKSE